MVRFRGTNERTKEEALYEGSEKKKRRRIRSHRQISEFETSFSLPESLQYLPSLWTLQKPFDRCINLCFLLGFEEIRVFFWMFWSWFLSDRSRCCCDLEEDRVRFVETSKQQISRFEEAWRGGGGSKGVGHWRVRLLADVAVATAFATAFVEEVGKTIIVVDTRPTA